MDNWHESSFLKHVKSVNEVLFYHRDGNVSRNNLSSEVFFLSGNVFPTIKSDTSSQAWLSVSSAGEQKPSEIHKAWQNIEAVGTAVDVRTSNTSCLVYSSELILHHQHAVRVLTTPTSLFELSINAQPLKA